MPNHGDVKRAEPGIPPGTNASLLSSSSPRGPGSGRSADTTHRDGAPSARRRHIDGSLSVKRRVRSMAERGKSRVAGGLHDLGDRIEHTGRGLASGNGLVRPVGRALDSAGDALEGGASYLHSNDFGMIRDDVVEWIREHPVLSAGIAAGCGWVLGRMMRGESGEHAQDPPGPQGSESERQDAPRRAGRVRGHVADLAGDGIAFMAARRVRNRIAGR